MFLNVIKINSLLRFAMFQNIELVTQKHHMYKWHALDSDKSRKCNFVVLFVSEPPLLKPTQANSQCKHARTHACMHALSHKTHTQARTLTEKEEKEICYERRRGVHSFRVNNDLQKLQRKNNTQCPADSA